MNEKKKRRQYNKDLPLLSAINNEIDGIIRWCTPSIHPMVNKVKGIYDNDISVSYHSLGSPALNTGIFRKAHERAAKVYKSDRTLFSVNGSTGSNFIVMRALKRQLGAVQMLSQRNIHKSISVGMEDYHIDTIFLPARYDDVFQIFIPNKTEEIVLYLKKFPKINVLFLSNPTYEGLSLNLPEIVEEVRKIRPELIIFVDEAWGSLFQFSVKLPPSAMDSGADISVQSTHKQGSSLQQTGMIHWNEKRVSTESMMNSYRALSTTSPSFHLLASLDGARYLMETKGKLIIDEILEVSDILRSELNNLPGVNAVFPEEIMDRHNHIKYSDRTKVLINIENTALTGYEIASHLEDKYRIIVEKYDANHLLFMTTFQNHYFEVQQTVKSFKSVLKDLQKRKTTKSISFPKFPTKILRHLPSYQVVSINNYRSEQLKNSVGRVSAEDIVPYPPGVPLIIKGEKIQIEHILYLQALRKTNGLMTVVMDDAKLKTILTLKR